MRDVLPRVIVEAMAEKYAYEALRREGTIRGLPVYVEGSYYLPEACVEQFERLSQEELDALIGQTVSTAQYLFRTSPAALKLILDDRVQGHLNAFVRMELAGLEVYLVHARHLMRWLQVAGVAYDHGCCSDASFKTQLDWLHSVDGAFPTSMAMAFFSMRRDFVVSRKLVGKCDLYEYVRLPENAIFAFDQVADGENSSLALERRNIHRAMYGSVSENMVFDVTRDIIRSNSASHSLASPVDW